MRLIVDLHELFDADVGILLGGGKAGVAQQFLDAAKIGTRIQQMGRKGMAQDVRRNAFTETGFPEIFPHHPFHTARRQSPAAPIAHRDHLPNDLTSILK